MAEFKMRDFDLVGQLGKELQLIEVTPKMKYEKNEVTGKNGKRPITKYLQNKTTLVYTETIKYKGRWFCNESKTRSCKDPT